MRDALNENPVVQTAVIGLLAVGVGFLLLTRVVGGGSSGEASPSTASDQTGTPSAGEVAAGGSTIPEAGSATSDGDAAAGGPVPQASEFESGPGLPKDVVDAYRDGKAVALLVTREHGIEDRRLRQVQSRIRSAGDVEVFHAYARDIARYSRIAGGVDVSRVPALVVIRPREHSESGVPVASVSYGFRGPASAEQAVRDALYEGRRDIPYYPYPERPNGGG